MKVVDIGPNMEPVHHNQVILKVYEDNRLQELCEVPITPNTTCSDVVDCCRPATAHTCHLVELWRGCERPVGLDEQPFEMLRQWGPHREEVVFFLRHGQGPSQGASGQGPGPPALHGTFDWSGNGLRADNNMMPSGVDLTLTELQEMASRQQQQIEAQQQMLVAKEQRLKFLKQQELRHHQIASENERLRKLREKVETQELKLKKLRALRGQANDQKSHNSSLTSELESIKSLFNEKEKELTVAVSKVDDLSKQLEELRRGRLNGLSGNTTSQTSPSLLELEKLRKELTLRNKLNDQQNSKLAAHTEIFQQRKEEMCRMDSRIAELQSRLQKKKQNEKEQIGSVAAGNRTGRPVGSNIAAVEPYIQHKAGEDSNLSDIQKITDDGFQLGKQDPKYQTLPYNIKFPATDDKQDVYVHVAPKKISEEMAGDKGKETGVNTPRYSNAGRIISHFAPKPYGSNRTPIANNKADLKPAESPSVLYTSVSTPSTGVPPKTSTPVTPALAANNKRMKEIFITAAPTVSSSGVEHKQEHPKTNALGPASVPQPYNRPYPMTRERTMPPDMQRHQQRPLQSKLDSRPASSPLYTAGFPNQAPSQVPSVQVEASDKTISASSDPNSDCVLDTSGTAVSSAISVLMAPATTTAAASKPSYRYAPKSVIANTYMSRLGTSALQQYQQNKSASSNENSSAHPGSPTATVRPVRAQTAKPDSSSTDSYSPNKSPHYYHRRPHSPPADHGYDRYSNGPPPYPGVPPYKMDPHYKPNAPRPLRRRWSITEMDEHPKHGQIRQHRLSSEGSQTPSEQLVDVVHVDQAIPDHGGGSNSSTLPQSSSQTHVVSSLSESTVKNIPAPVVIRRKTNLKNKDKVKSSRRVSFDPLALLLDASLEGELELVKTTARQVTDPSASNDEGITALHNAICAGHYDIVRFLVEYGCNVNSPDSDGWTPLHCAASCNNLPMVKFLVEHGACIFAATISDQETAAEKCEEDEDGYDGCSEYLYSVQEKLGILNKGCVYAVFDYEAQNTDEISFHDGDMLSVVRKGDDEEKEWWWARKAATDGYIPRNLLGLYPRVVPEWLRQKSSSSN